MGIKDLLRFMKPFITPVHIKKYAGKRVGIDAYSWLHKGAYSCSMELCQNSDNEKKSRYLQYFMHRINLLKHHKVIPVVVFDGGNIPCKSDTERERSKKRKANLALAREQLNQGNISAAIELFQRAVSITPYMAHQLIQILKSKSVEFVVAPYEADAQLAYLSSLDAEQGGIDAVITEDSDLMAYGCQSVIFKMDKFGNGEEILLDKVFNPVDSIQEKKKSTAFVPSFRNFDKELFTGMCVLAGCDFLPSITGIGIRRAYTFISKYMNLDRVLSVLKFEKGGQIPEDYAKSFKKAVAVFHHARVFDCRTKTIKTMKPLPEELLNSLDGDLDFLGPEIPSSVAIAIAKGHLDPISMKAFDHFPKDETNHDVTIPKSHQSMRAETETETETQGVSTKGSCFTVFSSSDTREAKIEDEKQSSALDQWRLLNEVCALQKLVAPQKLTKRSVEIVEKIEYPDNNPFKKRKIEETSITTQVSVVTSDTKSNEVLCLTPENNNSDEVVCLTPESQVSVSSKPFTKRIAVNKAAQKETNLLKRKTNSKTPDSSNRSILSFFNRL